MSARQESNQVPGSCPKREVITPTLHNSLLLLPFFPSPLCNYGLSALGLGTGNEDPTLLNFEVSMVNK